jgi:MSHA biogenesis protein MshN
VLKLSLQPATQQQAPVAAASRPKAPVVVAQASAPPKEEPTSKAETSPREIKQEDKPMERTDSAIATAIKPPARSASENRTQDPGPAADAKPSAPASAAGTGQAAAPALDATKASISVERQDRDASRPERASAEYRTESSLRIRGGSELAFDAYVNALRLVSAARCSAPGTGCPLLGRGRGAEAQGVLREGLAVLPENTAWAVLLARLQVEGRRQGGCTGDARWRSALREEPARLPAFVATLLQMQGRHKEAIAHYDIAVSLSPASGRG